MLIVAYVLFISNFLFGLLVRVGMVPAARFRIVHRLLYALVLLSLAAAAAVSIAAGRGIPWPLVLVGVLLLGMPFFPGRKTAHAIYAVLCLAMYTAVVYATIEHSK